jgi:cytidine deaminase
MAPRRRTSTSASSSALLDLTELVRAAARARRNAYAPYSRFPVGAAVLAGGRIFAGVNVENSSFPQGVCAERTAVGSAVTAGFTKLEAVAIVGGSLRPIAPCGGCRQTLSEFCGPDTPIVCATPGGETVQTTMAALLPSAFGARDLEGVPVASGAADGPAAAALPLRRTAKR